MCSIDDEFGALTNCYSPADETQWVLTAGDSMQHVRKIRDYAYELVEMAATSDENKFLVFTDVINVNHFVAQDDDLVESALNYFGYTGIKEIIELYGDKANQIIAECIFEYKGIYSANHLFTGTEDQCVSFIKNYVGG